MERRRRLPPLAVDSVIALAVFALGLISQVEISDVAPEMFSRQPDFWARLLIAAQTLPLALRRRYPRSIMLVVLSAFVIDRWLDYPSTFATAGIVLGIHAVGSELDRKTSLRFGWSVAIFVAVFTFLGYLTVESVGLEDVGFTFLSTAIPLALGREVYQRRQTLEQLEERAERAERDRAEEAARAVAEERARIARELHDVVAHQMTVMTLQAEGARRIAKEADPRVVEALDTIRRSGHEALSEMRRMVGLLRTEPEDVDLAPQPGVDRLDELIGQMRDAGLDVELSREGMPRPLAPGVDVNVYRIVQESLTNVIRHGGPGVVATVTLTYGSDSVEVEVVDDGRGRAAALNGDSGGHGLVGMRERVGLLDGRFEAGPRPGGGFGVHAVIPVSA
ncbi:MAG: sensor histidine kinase [Acidimicrobiia bacterium]|nr:sensor histidine kinase [Acidimicrobiia bacterium]